ncbi:MAG: isopentenyl-diphosphate Delta-isomerase [Flavobacteriales bacterium]|nr:isopentenyl-diphosphate Delta-isomerase [Flavobacteriales bacterium]
MDRTQVILVDENDKQVGLTEKMFAHQQGLLHRAVSVFVFSSAGKLLLQKRANSKYHGAGLWTNTCCTHPLENEGAEDCAHRRLKEEMGFDCDLEKKFAFTYRSEVENDLIEHEYDHVFFGVYDGEVDSDSQEVEDHTFVSIDKIREDLEENPDKYSVWFRIIVENHKNHLTGMEHQLKKAVGV